MSVVCVLVLLFASPTSLAVAAGTRVLSVEPDYGKAGEWARQKEGCGDV